MIKQMIRRIASGGGSARRGRRGGRRATRGGTGATVGAAVERFMRSRR